MHGCMRTPQHTPLYPTDTAAYTPFADDAHFYSFLFFLPVFWVVINKEM